MASVIIQRGVGASDPASSVPREQWPELVSARRDYCRSAIADDCRLLAKFVNDAETCGWLGYSSRDDYLLDGLGLAPQMIEWAAEGLRLLDTSTNTVTENDVVDVMRELARRLDMLEKERDRSLNYYNSRVQAVRGQLRALTSTNKPPEPTLTPTPRPGTRTGQLSEIDSKILQLLDGTRLDYGNVVATVFGEDTAANRNKFSTRLTRLSAKGHIAKMGRGVWRKVTE